MKPFDLGLALQGHPVVTRTGDKAHVTNDNRETAHNLGIKLKNSYAFSGFVYRPADPYRQSYLLLKEQAQKKALENECLHFWPNESE